MAFPQQLDPAAPVGSDSPRLGDNQLRDLKQLLADLFTLPVSPSTISATIGSVSTAGKLTLTNALWNADAIGVAYGGTGLATIADAAVLATNSANALTAVVAGASQSIRRNAGNTAWEAFTPGTGAGSVTSVAQSFTGGLVAVSGSPITASGTLALTVAGTSGGIPYFSGATTWASSGALTASALILGGGAGAAPTPLASLGTTTTLLHGNAAGAPTFGAVSLAADVTGTLPVANGGTSLTTLTANNVMLGNGASAPGFVAPGTSGNVLTSNGTTWTSAAAGGGGGKAVVGLALNEESWPVNDFTTFFFTDTHATEAKRRISWPLAGTFKNLYVRTYGTHFAANTVITMRVNGIDSALTVTVPASSAAGTFKDITHSVQVDIEDFISFRATTRELAPGELAGLSLEFDPS